MSSVLEDLIILKRELNNLPEWRTALLLPIRGLSNTAGNVIESVTGLQRPFINHVIISRDDLSKVIELLEVICE